MGERTKIAWCDDTFNFGIGCEPAIQPDGKPHPGCVHCYARAQNEYRGWVRGPDGEPTWGPAAPRKVTSEDTWAKPRRWARAAAKAGKRRKVFCASLADVLDPKWPAEVLGRLWDLIRDTARLCSSGPAMCPDGHDGMDSECPHCGKPAGGLDWLLLTKRPERWAVIPQDVRPLVWLGTSASDQPTWDEWVRRLAKAEGFARLFVSLEPLVGPVDGSKLLGYCHHCDKGGVIICADGTHARCERPVVSWVIIGGESGPKARTCDVAWIRAIVGQCRAAGVAPFVKQLGTAFSDLPNGIAGRGLYIDPDFLGIFSRRLTDSHGGDPSEWPEPFPREFPGVSHG